LIINCERDILVPICLKIMGRDRNVSPTCKEAISQKSGVYEQELIKNTTPCPPFPRLRSGQALRGTLIFPFIETVEK